jgi:undecaprenyl diphosphate synthase
MDGNGRWAELRGLPRSEGHKRGVERVSEIARSACGVGVKALSLYAFSLENWKRPESEISVLMKLLETFLINDLDNFMKDSIRFRVIGNREKLPEHIKALIENVEKLTENNSRLILQCALSYGGRDEIVRAVKKIVRSGIPAEEITEENLGSLMDTAGMADPDLIIRTSGEQRLSNFLLWQSAYSEFLFTSTLWPDFTKEEFLEALYQYQMRDRRFGKVKEGTIQCS